VDEPRQGGSDRPLTRRELRALDAAREAQAAAEDAESEQGADEAAAPVVPTPARPATGPIEPAVAEPAWAVPAQAAPRDDAPWEPVRAWEQPAPQPRPAAERARRPEREPEPEPEPTGDWATTAGTTWADDVRWSLHGELPRALPPEPDEDDIPAALDDPGTAPGEPDPAPTSPPVTRTPVRTSVTRASALRPEPAGRSVDRPAADGPPADEPPADEPDEGPDGSPVDDAVTPARGVPGPPPRVSAWGGAHPTGATPAQPPAVPAAWQVVPQWPVDPEPAAADPEAAGDGSEQAGAYPIEWAGVDDEAEPELLPWLPAHANGHADGEGADAYVDPAGAHAAYAAPPVPVPLPTLDDLIAARPETPAGPAEHGWRGTLRRATGGLLTLRPGPAEVEHREAVAMVQRPLDGPRTIVVINPKGGAHKTTATLLLAATFGQHRGGYTLAWDNNETRGTLGWRALPANHQRTAVTLLQDLDRFADLGAARVGDLDGYVRAQGSAQFDVLASDEDAASAASIDAFAFRALHRTLARFYRVMVVDTGNNLRASNWQAAVEAADQVVIVSTVREDTAQSAAWAVDALRAQGFEDTVRRAVTVLSDPAPQRDPHLAERLHDHFGRLTRAVVDVPYDKTLVGGTPLDVERLDRRTREAWLRVAAVVAEGL
jgi:MinD-like ATPase involved in chromosome partitioning or flagellar assembly